MTLRTTRQYAEVLVQGAGKLRVTRQVAEVLATGSGKARVSRQYVEYLISNTAPPSGIHNVAAADALTCTDAAHLTPIPCKIQDGLTLADSNLCNGTKRNRAIDSLNLSRLAEQQRSQLAGMRVLGGTAGTQRITVAEARVTARRLDFGA